MLYQLTYISTARPGLGREGVTHLLEVSRRNNAAAGLTGLLVYDGRRFLQALEGEQRVLRATFERIKEDPRHRAVVMLSAREVSAREFGQWDMGWTRASVAAPREGELAAIIDTLVADVPDPNTRALFRGFARVKRDAA